MVRAKVTGIVIGVVAGVTALLALTGSDPSDSESDGPSWVDAGIPEQAGLVPLGVDPASGLHEFAVEASGRVPVRGDDGNLVFSAETAVVLVLVPGGTYRRGAQADPERSEFDDRATDFEGPVTVVAVPSLFLAKHETTAAQWSRLTGEGEPGVAPTLPRTDVNWAEARERLVEVGLRLPTEAEWEYACRAGTTSRYWSGDTLQDLVGVGWTRENSADGTAFMGDSEGAIHPVGGLAANAFGLHDVHGNVAEWCEDRWHASYRGAPLDGRAWTDGATRGRVARGGSWFHVAEGARSASRRAESPGRVRSWLGVRIARSVEAGVR